MSNSAYCPIIHGGLHVVYDVEINDCVIQQCCLHNLGSPIVNNNIWDNLKFNSTRQLNNNNIWLPECNGCLQIENAGQESHRTGALKKFGIQSKLSGPTRLDLMIDRSCNLACRICGPDNSTLWQKLLREHRVENIPNWTYESAADKILEVLKKLDLSNLELVVFGGGETLMGKNFWKVAEYLAQVIPNVKEKLTLSFQTNGTQTVDIKYYELIEKFHLVKFNISLDGVGDKFEYLRWPAKWDQVVDNIMQLRQSLPVNVMFLVEETMSIYNLYYYHELENWLKINFSENRLGDKINHSRHIAQGSFNLNNLTQEYHEAIADSGLYNLIERPFQENPISIKQMIETINKVDQTRDEDWTKTFPEVAEFYSRYLR